MHLRDLSLRTKLLLTNALMVVIPICVLVAIGAALLGGLRHAGTLQQQALELLWPEKGTNLSVPLALSSLRAAAERKQFKWSHVERDVHLLESAGVRVSIVQDGLLYLTDEADADDIRYAVMRECGARGSALTWNDAGLFFRYEGKRSGIIFMGAGTVPMMRHHDEMRISPPMRETVINAVFIFFIVITSAGIFLLGRYLARLLSAQILAPLAAMRDASAAMQHGDFDHVLPPMGSDEVGATCRAFDAMRSDLRRARLREEQEEARRREFLIGVLHDIATPLTAVKGYASGLIDGIAATPEKQRAYAERIARAAATMEGLTTQLRAFLRTETGEVSLTWEVVEARTWLTAFIDAHAADVRERGIELSMAEGGGQTYIRIDRSAFARVLENLWENSGKYRRGERAHVSMSLSYEGDFLTIRCDDDGVGVREEERERLFDLFYRTDAARTHVADGSGLGLAIVRRIMTTFGGTVRAEESPAGGLRIVLLLPIQKKEDTHEKDTAGRG